jgi:FAD:protein FMN transferase
MEDAAMKDHEKPAPPAGPGRRAFLAMGAGALLVASVPFARARARRVRYAVPAMGTVAELSAVHRDERYARAALRAAAGELRRVEAMMTRFSPSSDVGRANVLAAREPVAVSPETALVVGEALRWAHATGGGFDPALALAVDLWDVKRRTAPPPPDAVRRLAGRDLHRSVGIEGAAAAPRLSFADPEVQLDLGGIAGGYGVDRAGAVLRDWGIENGFVNLGGDILALGVAEDGEPWTVGIRSPHDPGALAGSVRLSDRAIATSGDYEQYFEHGGRRYHHILDPRTGAPRVSVTRSVTVTAESCLAVDAATTACFGLDPDAARALLARAAPGAELVHLG